ncbi:acyl-CoA dehydrogenase family protein [Natrinema caseinilyticum]|uniref:acyl-CoA dehydrogenase family protein n=1 Tax=Natrinema caseinilyticum TaxID=2961570 RepID=UPI0020C5B169|nr:acyl-CoA dehydrogenase [Natrinema caseinilyticum]
MVTFEPGEEIQLMEQTLGEFVERELRPLEERNRDLLVPDHNRLRSDGRLTDDALALVRKVRRLSGDVGFYGADMPESVGGNGITTVGLVHLVSRLYSHGYGLNIHAIESAPGPHPNFLTLNDDLVGEYVEPAVRGEKSACFALTESSSGSDATDMATTAERDGDEWVIDGTKMWITNSPYADFGQVFAVTDPDASGADGISAFMFDTDNPGFEVRRITQTMLNDGMQAEVAFDGCRVPDAQLIGERGEGFHLAMGFLNKGRVRIAARCAGLLEYLQEQVVEYANERESWGVPIGKRQHVRRMAAEIATWRATVENLVLKAAWLIDQGADPAEHAAIAKYYATEKLYEAADNAVQIFGANGLSHEYPIQRIFRFARVMRIPEGSSEIQLETIASEVGL